MTDLQPRFVLPQPTAPWWRLGARSLRRALLQRRLERAPDGQKKIWNSQLNWREFWHGRTTLASRPRLVQVGTNWTCNLRCAFCRLTMPWTRQWLGQKEAGELQIAPGVLATVKELMLYAEMVTLTPLGEPLLWGGLRELLEYHASIGSHNLALTSNGMLLTDAAAERLVRGQLSSLYLSVDSNDPEVYASMRVGGELRQVEEGILRVRAWKERLAVPWPRITINATFMARNIDQLPSMVGWARELGCDALSVQLMEMENPELEPEFLGHCPERAAAALRAAQARGLELGFNVRPHAALLSLVEAAARGRDVAGLDYLAASQVIPAERKPDGLAHQAMTMSDADGGARDRRSLVERCAYPWYNLLIDTDGEVRPCCWAGVSWGNLNRTSLDEIWNGPPARGMRQAFLQNIVPRACRKKHCRVDL